MSEQDDQAASPALADRTMTSLAGEAADMAQSTIVTGLVAGLLVVVSVPFALALGARHMVRTALARRRAGG
jgi:hypothetical protein